MFWMKSDWKRNILDVALLSEKHLYIFTITSEGAEYDIRSIFIRV